MTNCRTESLVLCLKVRIQDKKSNGIKQINIRLFKVEFKHLRHLNMSEIIPHYSLFKEHNDEIFKCLR